MGGFEEEESGQKHHYRPEPQYRKYLAGINKG